MNRFFVEKANIIAEDKSILIDDNEDIKHISKVLRLNEGDKIEICDKNSKDYIAKITKIENDLISCEITKEFSSKGEPPIEVVLFQGLPKSTKMDLIVQKCVELGVTTIVPINTNRSIVKIKDRKSENKKIERWNKIALEAAKQCKRGIIPCVKESINFNDIENYINDFDCFLLPYENEETMSLKKVLRNNPNVKKIGIIIGPEGGFDQAEIIMSKSWGINTVTLGPRILRTETAGFVTASILIYELGDLGGS